MNALWNTVARLVVWVVWQPLDRTVCRFAEVTHEREGEL